MVEHKLESFASASGRTAVQTESSIWGDHVRNAVVCFAFSWPIADVILAVSHRAAAQPQPYRDPNYPSTLGRLNMEVVMTTESSNAEEDMPPAKPPIVKLINSRITLAELTPPPIADDIFVGLEDASPTNFPSSIPALPAQRIRGRLKFQQLAPPPTADADEF
jgi:hypothetical protein